MIRALFFPPPEVRLSLSADVTFPPVCARCGAPDPGSWVTIRASRPSLLRALAGIGFLKGERSWRVPHCARCRVRTVRLGFLLNLIGFLWFLGAIFLAIMITAPLGRPWSVLMALPLVLLLAMPALLWIALCPAPVEASLEDRDVVFTFRDPDLALRFQDQNQSPPRPATDAPT